MVYGSSSRPTHILHTDVIIVVLVSFLAPGHRIYFQAAHFFPSFLTLLLLQLFLTLFISICQEVFYGPGTEIYLLINFVLFFSSTYLHNWEITKWTAIRCLLIVLRFYLAIVFEIGETIKNHCNYKTIFYIRLQNLI